jgi:hypothetical protein
MNLRPSVSKKSSSSSCCMECLGGRYTAEIVRGLAVSSTVTLDPDSDDVTLFVKHENITFLDTKQRGRI